MRKSPDHAVVSFSELSDSLKKEEICCKNALISSLKTWLTTKEAALYLGSTPGGIRNRVYRGQLKAYKFLGRNYFKREELDQLIEASGNGGFNGN